MLDVLLQNKEDGGVQVGECDQGIRHLPFFFFLNFFFNVYLFLGQRETEHERGRGRERGRHRMETGSRL